MWSSRKRSLDVAALGLVGRDLEIANVIAEETEAQRASELAQLPPPHSDTSPLGGFGLFGRQPQTDEEYARQRIEAQDWETLLLQGNVHARCSERSGLRLAEVIAFALEKCRPDNWEALFWYGQWVREALSDKLPADAVLAMLANKEQEVAAARAAYERSRKGASAGGMKSAEVRRAKAKVPNAATLQAEKQRLLAGGTAPRNVVGKLANMYGVSDVAIRTKLAEAEKEK